MRQALSIPEIRIGLVRLFSFFRDKRNSPAYCSRAIFASRAFSLIEVTIALGILAFALVGIMGILPVGLRTMGDAIDDSTSSLITRRMVGEARQSSFDALLSMPSTTRYFDFEGQEVASASSSLSVYKAVTTVSSTGSSSNLALVSITVSKNNSGNRTFVSHVARH